MHEHTRLKSCIKNWHPSSDISQWLILYVLKKKRAIPYNYWAPNQELTSTISRFFRFHAVMGPPHSKWTLYYLSYTILHYGCYLFPFFGCLLIWRIKFAFRFDSWGYQRANSYPRNPDGDEAVDGIVVRVCTTYWCTCVVLEKYTTVTVTNWTKTKLSFRFLQNASDVTCCHGNSFRMLVQHHQWTLQISGWYTSSLLQKFSQCEVINNRDNIINWTAVMF